MEPLWLDGVDRSPRYEQWWSQESKRKEDREAKSRVVYGDEKAVAVVDRKEATPH